VSSAFLLQSPGFLATVAKVEVASYWVEIYHYAWFVGFWVSMGTYLVLMKAFGMT
jgi:cytosine/uracil/thiamine/allantoin permease